MCSRWTPRCRAAAMGVGSWRTSFRCVSGALPLRLEVACADFAFPAYKLDGMMLGICWDTRLTGNCQPAPSRRGGLEPTLDEARADRDPEGPRPVCIGPTRRTT